MKINTIFALALLTSSTAFAEKKEHREHDAHEHGHAQLSVVLEESNLQIMLESPAMNIFGFEHKPKKEEQKKIVALAVKDLENFEPLLLIADSAKCNLVKVDVHQPFEVKSESKHEHEENAEESTHTDVDVEVSFTCQNAAKLTQIDLAPLFKRFPGFEELDTQKIINGKQSAEELSKEMSILKLN